MLQEAINNLKEKQKAGVLQVKAEELAMMLNMTRANIFYWHYEFGLPMHKSTIDIEDAIDFLCECCEESVIIKKEISAEKKEKKKLERLAVEMKSKVKIDSGLENPGL